MTWGRGWRKAAVKSKDDQQAGNLGERQEISPSEPPARIKPKFGRLASGIVREYVSWPPCDHVLQQLQELIHLPMFTLHKQSEQTGVYGVDLQPLGPGSLPSSKIAASS